MNAITQIDVAEPIPSPDFAAIRSHIKMLHDLATGAGVDGVLTLTRIDDEGGCFTERFAIGDVDTHTTATIGWASNPRLNLYVPWSIFRKDFPRGSKGGEDHVVALLAIVGDLDSDLGKTSVTLDGLLVQPTYVVETSRGNFHATYPLSRALSPKDAKPLATKMSEAIGGDNGTKDISHLWRIPGTLNWPSKKKLERGRPDVPQLVTVKQEWNGDLVDTDVLWEAVKDAKLAKLAAAEPSQLSTGQVTIDWAQVERHAGWLKSVSDLPSDFNSKGKLIVAHEGNIRDLNFDLKEVGHEKEYQSWSEVTHALVAVFKHHGKYTNEQIAAALLCDLPCNRHVTKIVKESERRRAIERTLTRSYERQQVQRKDGEPDWRERRSNNSPVPSMHNARIAIAALGVTCSRDTFHNKTLFGYRDEKFKHELQSLLGEVGDDGIMALRQLMSDRFGFDLTEKHTRDAVVSLALENCFNPVCDEIDKAEAEWDGVKRLDRMAAEYFNCEDTPLNSAFMRKMMIGLVKRAREPGCKFDTIVVLESNEGFNKSTAWRVLAGEENFSDERILGKESREVQEQLSGIWIHENADLAGLKKTDVESVKAYASRQYDIARPAFGHYVAKQPRHSIEVGTTNASTYLQSQTGNRRFWPMTVMQPIDIEKLKRDRLQLIGEAARYLTEGESVVLDKLLWGDAGVEQEKRRVKDPWEDTLEVIHQHTTGKYLSDGKWAERQVQIIYYSNAGHDEAGMELVASADLLQHVLDVPVERQTTAHTMRLATIMTRLGWQRHKGGHVRINGKRVSGYFRPEQKPEPKPLF
jgi:predicted P-loop ATPase